MTDTAYRSVEVEEVEPGWLVDLGDDGVLTVARVLKLAEGVELYGSTTRQPSRKRTVVFRRHEIVSVFADGPTLNVLENVVTNVLLDAGFKSTSGTGEPTALVVEDPRGEPTVWRVPFRNPDGSNWHGPKPTADDAADLLEVGRLGEIESEEA